MNGVVKPYHQMLAERIWFFIKNPKKMHEKRDVRNAVNKRHHTFFSTRTLFNRNVRVYLERFAAEQGMVLVNENGYVFVTGQEDWAYRVTMRRLRMHTTLGLNMENPGAGVSLLRGSEVDLYQQLAVIVDSMIAVDHLVQMLIQERMALIKEQDAEARKLAKESIYNHKPE